MPERSCVNCKSQDEWGCDAEYLGEDGDGRARWHKPAHLPLEIDGEEVFRCPRQHMFRNPRYWNRLLTFYGFYKQGFLPAPGSVVDQANKALEVFQVLDSVHAKCDAEAVEARERPKGDPFLGRGNKR